jgi:hypothetical protein
MTSRKRASIIKLRKKNSTYTNIEDQTWQPKIAKIHRNKHGTHKQKEVIEIHYPNTNAKQKENT